MGRLPSEGRTEWAMLLIAARIEYPLRPRCSLTMYEQTHWDPRRTRTPASRSLELLDQGESATDIATHPRRGPPLPAPKGARTSYGPSYVPAASTGRSSLQRVAPRMCFSLDLCRCAVKGEGCS